MARLPTVGGDDAAWGAILNEILENLVSFDAGSKALPVMTPYKIRATLSVSQGFQTNTYTPVRYNNLLWTNAGSYFDTNSGTFTVPVSGYYAINAAVAIYNNGYSGERMIAILTNGGETCRGDRYQPASSTGIDHFRISDVIQLSANDNVNIWLYTSATSSLNSDPTWSMFEAHLVGK